MDTNNNIDPDLVLYAWRTKILNGFLIIVAVAATVMTAVSILDAISRPGQWPAVIVFFILDLVLIVLAFFQVDYRIRAWGVLLVPYVVGVTALASFGLGSSGRLYLLVLPIGALILLGVRSGIIMSVLSILTMIVFTILADRGVLLNWLVSDRNSLLAADWLAEFVDTVMLLTTIMALLIMFYRFQERLIEKERSTQAELLHAQKLLEEQNATLEQKIKERTGELQTSYLDLEHRNAELALLNSVSDAVVKTLDVKTMTHLVGDKVREIFDSDSAIIMLLDRHTNLIHVPYEFDKDEGGYIDYVEPFPLGTGLSSKVIISGQPLLIGTLEEEIDNGAYFPPEIIEKGSGFYSQSWLGVPIMAKEQVLGLVALADARLHAFNENHLRLLQTLSSNMGVAIENAWLFQAEQQRVTELEIINSIQQGLAAELDFQSIVDLVGDKLREVFNTPDFMIGWYEEKTNLMHYLYLCEHGQRINVPSIPPLSGGKFETMQKTRRPIVLNTLADYETLNASPIPGTDQSKSLVSVPIISNDRVLGLIQLENYERENAYGESEIRLLTTIAGSLGAALENARLFNEAQRLLKATEQRAAELAIINSVQAGLASKLDLQSIYELIGEKVREAFNVQVVDIVIYDPVTNLISMPYSYEKGDRSVIAPREPYGFRLDVINSRAPLLINQDFAALAVQRNNPLLTGDWPKSALFVPLLENDKVKGIISIQDLDRENAYSASDVRLIQTLANSMSIALENTRLFNETQQRAAELATVNAVSTALISELDLSALINLVGEQIRSVFKTDIVYVALLDEESNVINFPYQYGEQLESLQFGQGLTSRIIQSGKPLLINQEMERQREQLGTTLVGKRARSFLGVPIFVSGKATGVVSVQSTTQEGLFTKNDQHLLSTIAANVGIALQNARLFDEIKHHEQDVREAAEKLRLIFENAFDGIDIYEDFPSTGKRVLLDCNDRYCELAGRSREELMSVDNTGVFQRSIHDPLEGVGELILKSKGLFGDLLVDSTRWKREHH